jgi:hypothetical protein
MAQDYTAPLPEAPAAAPEASDSAIVVTGTRIKRADLQQQPAERGQRPGNSIRAPPAPKPR